MGSGDVLSSILHSLKCTALTWAERESDVSSKDRFACSAQGHRKEPSVPSCVQKKIQSQEHGGVAELATVLVEQVGDRLVLTRKFVARLGDIRSQKEGIKTIAVRATVMRCRRTAM